MPASILKFKWKQRLLGEHALMFYLPEQMDTRTSLEIKNFNDFLVSKNLPELNDIIPSYHTLTLIYKIELINDPLKFANNLIEEYLVQTLTTKEDLFHKNIIEVPVCFDENFGFDLKNISDQFNLSVAEIIEIYTEKIYQVYCLGFMPGFAYMGEVPSKIQIPRHNKPRKNVTAGSVGIAGPQTGIYPMNSPGGWQIIGRTPLKIFDMHPAILSKFKMGDQVKFYSISFAEFDTLNEHGN